MLIFLLRSDLREHYDLKLSRKATVEGVAVAHVSWREASRDGFYAMLLDVAAQMSITAGIYVAAAMCGDLAARELL